MAYETKKGKGKGLASFVLGAYTLTNLLSGLAYADPAKKKTPAPVKTTASETASYSLKDKLKDKFAYRTKKEAPYTIAVTLGKETVYVIPQQVKNSYVYPNALIADIDGDSDGIITQDEATNYGKNKDCKNCKKNIEKILKEHPEIISYQFSKGRISYPGITAPSISEAPKTLVSVIAKAIPETKTYPETKILSGLSETGAYIAKQNSNEINKRLKEIQAEIDKRKTPWYDFFFPWSEWWDYVSGNKYRTTKAKLQEIRKKGNTEEIKKTEEELKRISEETTGIVLWTISGGIVTGLGIAEMFKAPESTTTTQPGPSPPGSGGGDGGGGPGEQ